MQASHAQEEGLGLWADYGLALLLSLLLGWACLDFGGVRAGSRLLVDSALLLLVLLQLLRAAFLPGGRVLRAPGAAGWLTGAFLGLGLLHVLWLSPVPWLALGDWLDFSLLAAAAWLAGSRTPPGAARWILAAGLAAAALASVGLGLFQVLSDPLWLPLGRRQVSAFVGRASGGFGIPNSLAGLLLLVLPPAAFLVFRRDRPPWLRVLAGYLTLVFAAGLLLARSRGAWFSLALVLLLWPLLAWRGHGLRRLTGVCLVFCALALGASALYEHSEDSRARLESLAADGGERSRPVLWRAALAEFLEHPLLGGGLGSYPAAFELARPESLQADPVRPHNEYLDTLSGLGLAGLLLGGSALLAFMRPALPRPLAGGSGGRAFPGLGLGLAAFSLQLLLEFHLHVPALALAFALALGLAKAEARQAQGTAPLPRWLVLTLVVTLAAAYGGLLLPRLRAEALRRPAREAFDRLASSASATHGSLALSEKELRRAIALWPGHAQARADLSAVLAARWTPASPALAREAEEQARAALALSDTPWEFWVRLGVALDLQGRWEDAGPSFAEALARAPNRIETRYFLAWHFSLNRTTFGNARGLAAACLRLDPFHPQAQALMEQLEGHKSLPTRSP